MAGKTDDQCLKELVINMKTVLITGVSRKEGIGFATARELGRQNYKVILSARELDKAAILAEELNVEGILAEAVEMNITDEKSVRSAADEIEKKHGKVDILINNAALMLFTTDKIEDKKLTDFSRELETNLIGPWRVTQHFLPLLTKSESGRIVNISSSMGSINDSIWGLLQFDHGPIPGYSLAKLALNGLTIKMAKELKEHNILVNAVCPGYTATHAGMKDEGARPVNESVDGVVWVINFPNDGPTGQFFRDKIQIPW